MDAQFRHKLEAYRLFFLNLSVSKSEFESNTTPDWARPDGLAIQ